MNDNIKLIISVIVLLVMLSGIVFTAGTLRQQIDHNSVRIGENKAGIAERKLSGVEVRKHGEQIIRLETQILDNDKDHIFFIKNNEDIKKRLRVVEQKNFSK